MSLIEPFFSKTSSKARDMGLGFHILFNAGVTGRDYARIARCTAIGALGFFNLFVNP